MTSQAPNTAHNTLAQSQALSGVAPGVPLENMEMSRSATIRSDETDDLHLQKQQSKTAGPLDLNQESTIGSTDLEKAGEKEPHLNVLASLPLARKNFLTLCFCLAMVSFLAHFSKTTY